MRRRLVSPALLVLTAVGCAGPAAPPYDLVIAGGRAMDPETGLDAIRNVGIRDGTIRSISPTALTGRDTIDASGRVVAPGFIDLNTYQHGEDLFRLRAADGTTSVLMLEGGAVDVPSYYAGLEGRARVHYGVGVDHQTLRRIAAGDTTVELMNGMFDWPGINLTRPMPELDERALTDQEEDSLAVLVEAGLEAGAVAVGFGISYQPGATHEEILRMFELAAAHGAPSHVHVRDYHETRQWGEMYEMLGGAIYTGGDLHITHLQSIFGSFTEKALAFVDRAQEIGLELTAECYPYTASSTWIDSGSSDAWLEWPEERFQRYEWPATGERLTRESYARYREEGGIVIIHPSDPEGREEGVRSCVAHPRTMIASDGAWDSGHTHPRVSGTNARILGRYVREEGILSLMDALRKLSLDPARHLEGRVPDMVRKGRLQEGADADLVVFDPDVVIDRATYADPTLPSAGIDAVLVMGVPVLRDGVSLEGIFPGRALRGDHHAADSTGA